MSDYFENVEKYDKSIPFWDVYYVTEKGETKSVEIQAGTPEGAIRKAYNFYPDSVRVLISI